MPHMGHERNILSVLDHTVTHKRWVVSQTAVFFFFFVPISGLSFGR